MKTTTPLRFRSNSREALNDRQLRDNLRHTLGKTLHSREAAVAELPHWEQLRRHARAVKLHTLSRLGRYLRELEAAVQQRGGTVSWAETAAQATQLVLDLAHRRDFTRIVKSKSMLGEEIGLNEALERRLEVVETDLGEFVVQLAGQRPSHLVAPALHLSRAQVAALFEEKLEVSVGQDVERITAAARSIMRRHFQRAQMGITGVNFAAADSGTLVVVENEGNARLSVSVPRLHVAIMGIEKVIPRLADLSVFLPLLIRSATGQRITSYVDLIQGPRRPDEPDGPPEFVLILVDNGRSRILADPALRETLACIRCGACQNVCPVFQSVGGHAYGSTYQGPIGAILTPQLDGVGQAPEHPFASSLCGACREACPVGIPIPEILVELRGRVQSRKGAQAWRIPGRKWAFALWAWCCSSPGRYRRLLRLSRRLWPLAERLPRGAARSWSLGRTLPHPAPRPFRDLYRDRKEGP